MKRLHHEETAKDLKASLHERMRVGAGRVQQELRFNAINLGGIYERFK